MAAIYYFFRFYIQKCVPVVVGMQHRHFFNTIILCSFAACETSHITLKLRQYQSFFFCSACWMEATSIWQWKGYSFGDSYHTPQFTQCKILAVHVPTISLIWHNCLLLVPYSSFLLLFTWVYHPTQEYQHNIMYCVNWYPNYCDITSWLQ